MVMVWMVGNRNRRDRSKVYISCIDYTSWHMPSKINARHKYFKLAELFIKNKIEPFGESAARRTTYVCNQQFTHNTELWGFVFDDYYLCSGRNCR